MKKHIFAFTALTLAAVLLSGCSEKASGPNPAQGGDSSTTQSTSTTTESTQSTDSTESKSHEPASKEFFIYGEKEISDMSYPEHQLEDGRLQNFSWDGYQPSGDNVIFETHTFKDYIIRLVGENVSTDKADFPGRIFAQELYVEVEKDGKKLSETKGDDRIIFELPSGNSSTAVIFEDQIGNYLDIYELKHLVIAFRYFGTESYDESMRKLVQFAWIEDVDLVCGFFGNFAENTGLILSGATGFPHFANQGQFAVFSDNEFKIENENTLLDESAGIHYIFDFTKSDINRHFPGCYFRTEKIT